MTIKNTIKKFSNELKYVTHIPQKEIEILILHLLNKNIIWLHLNYDKEFMLEKELELLVKKRSNSFPLEYLINKASFYGETFLVEQGVLIPRPETEILVEKAYELLKEEKKPRILEIGVGSGIISIILAKLLSDVSIIAVDINKQALRLAKKNAIKHKVEDKIEFRLSNLFENVKENEFDILVSNPPYIENEYKLPKNVKFEPSNALFAGEKGDEILKNIILQSSKKQIKYLLCEMGYNHKKSLEEYFKKFDINKYEFYKDYESFDRGFILEFKDKKEKNV